MSAELVADRGEFLLRCRGGNDNQALLEHLQTLYPNLEFTGFSTSWIQDPKYILKAHGLNGDLIVTWIRPKYVRFLFAASIALPNGARLWADAESTMPIVGEFEANGYKYVVVQAAENTCPLALIYDSADMEVFER